ncbi:MAG: hypothetical protein RUDDFDWM_000502 [Candidatus Fervidibacterota bacterium]
MYWLTQGGCNINGAYKRLLLVGGNYRTMGIDVRERLSLCKVDVPNALLSLRSISGVSEVVFLSTCNRAEIYAVTDRACELELIEFLHRQHKLPRQELQKGLYVATDKGACTHLFRVAAGLDSMVLGEPQILGQIKNAYELAMRLKCCGKMLSHLFMRALKVGKRVRTETNISAGAVSIPHVAVKLAWQICGGFTDKKLLLIGVGEIGVLTLRLFKKHGVNQIVIANRTLEHAQQLAKQFGAVAIGLSELQEYLKDSDIVISCTASPSYLLTHQMISKALSERNAKDKMLIIDLAIPRDVEPSVAELEGLKLFNIDELADIADEYHRLRQDEAKRAEAIVTEEVNAFWRCWRSRWAEQLVVNLLNSAESVRIRTLREFSGKLATCDDGERKAIDMLTKRLVKRVLHPLIKKLKEMPNEIDDQMAFDTIVRLLQPFLEKGDGK